MYRNLRKTTLFKPKPQPEKKTAEVEVTVINRPSCHPVRYQPTIVFPLLLPRRCQLHALRTMQFPWAETMSVIIDKVPMGCRSYAKEMNVYPVDPSFSSIYQ